MVLQITSGKFMARPDTFLKELDKKLWTAADKLRANLGAAVYKHAVLGLIFLKYVSDSFDIRQQQIESRLCDKNDDYFLDPADYDREEAYAVEIAAELEAKAKAEQELDAYRQQQAALPEPVDDHFDQTLDELKRIEDEAKRRKEDD